MYHVKINKDLKGAIEDYCARNGQSISSATVRLFNEFINNEVNIPFEPVNALNNAEFTLNVSRELIQKVNEKNANGLQRTTRWVFCRLWQIEINKSFNKR